MYGRWWKELNTESNLLDFIRDRIVEMYFWMNGAMHEPQFSHSRIVLAKMIAFITIIDDSGGMDLQHLCFQNTQGISTCAY
jgi:hypothetical protein